MTKYIIISISIISVSLFINCIPCEAKIIDGIDYKDETIPLTSFVINYANGKDVNEYTYYVTNKNTMRFRQQMGKYLIYTAGNQQFATIPIKDLANNKQFVIPEGCYKYEGIVDFQNLDGFNTGIPLFKRIMSNKSMDGYGHPPKEIKKLILGMWASQWSTDNNNTFHTTPKKPTNLSKTFNTEMKVIHIEIFEKNGVYKKITYQKPVTIDRPWQKIVQLGTWSIEKNILHTTATNGKVYNLEKSKWVYIKEDGGSDQIFNRIIKLDKKFLVKSREMETIKLHIQSDKLKYLLDSEDKIKYSLFPYLRNVKK